MPCVDPVPARPWQIHFGDNPAALMILEGKAVEGDTLTVDVVDGRITVNV